MKRNISIKPENAPPPQKKTTKGMVSSKRLLEKKQKQKNNPNTGLWVELLVYLLDHSLTERLLVWCVTAVITFFPCHRRYAPLPKKKRNKQKQGLLEGSFSDPGDKL